MIGRILYGKIKEDVYACQPLGFEDLEFPDRVYKVEKALYGLHQAPKAWYKTLLTYLLDNGFHRGKIDKTLFIKRHKGDIFLVKVYVDDIIFGLTKKELCISFEKMMHEKFQMSSMGELTFFLGLQVKQKNDGIFISQDKYVAEILKIFGFIEVKNASTPIETQKPLLKNEDGEEVDVHMYRSMIGSLMYLTSSRLDIMFAVCACLWYLKDSPFDLVAYTDSDYAGASLARKSTTGGCQFLGCKLILWQCKKQHVVANSTKKADSGLLLRQNPSIGKLRYMLVWMARRKPTRKVTELPQSSDPIEHVADKAVYKELDDRFMKAATTAFSLEAEIGFLLENTKTTQANKIDSLKSRVKKLEKKQRSRIHKLKRLYKVGLTARDKGKAIMIEEPMKLKKKDQIMLDEEAALKLQAELHTEFDKKQRLSKEKAQKELEANIAMIETWNDVQAKIDADHQLAERMQVEEQQEFTDAEKATLFMQLLEKKRKSFATKRA
uniref:Uncharacterized mitochondrial protein AtMg00810-like n=1 Tax=Tanacetum cinerariifolium TaxID=118510 RepID=A0A699GT15_TANCI|nr:uncharacterized mitochondrial protein AtMg00810-like [Tanacetum cinerariifolium]